MNSKDALIKLLQENKNAREKFNKLGSVSEEEAEKELEKFEKEFGITIRKEDFAGQELNNEQLEGISGGATDVDPVGLILSIYGIIDRPDSTRRGSKGGSKRYK